MVNNRVRFSIICLITLLIALSLKPTTAQAQDGQAYTVQPGDQLSRIAEQFYGNVLAYPVIIEATNIKAVTDSSFAFILDPSALEVGQKLWIPANPDLSRFEILAPTEPAEPAPGQLGVFYRDGCPFLLTSGGASGQLQCGFVLVPEQHAEPDGPTIKLTVAVLRSSSDSPQPEPLVMAQGGPGGSGLELFPFLLTQAEAAPLRNRDIIIIEQRGTLYSDPFLFCQEHFDVQKELLGQQKTKASEARELEAIETCRTRLVEDGVNLDAYDSLENAADIVTVMDALDYEQFNVYGVSYGSMLGQHLMREHASRLRSVILDAVVPTEINFNDYIPTNFDRALRELFNWCADDLACNRQYPNLERVYFEVVDQLNAQPTTIELLNFGDFRNGDDSSESVDIHLDGNRLLEITFQSMYLPFMIQSFPAGIYAMQEGDYRWASLASGLMMQETFADGMYHSVLCAEEPEFLTLPESNLYPQIVAARLNQDGPKTCPIWAVEPLDGVVNQPVESDIPTLLYSGRFDPITPPRFADQVAESLSNAYTYTFASTAHGAIGEACAMRLMADFLDNPDQSPDASCLDDLTLEVIPLPARRASGSTAATDLTFTSITLDELGFSTDIPAGWQPMSRIANSWSDDQLTTITFKRETGDDLISIMTTEAGLKEIETTETQVGDVTWTTLQVNLRITLYLGATMQEGQVYLVRVVTPHAELGAAVFDQALERFTLAE